MKHSSYLGNPLRSLDEVLALRAEAKQQPVKTCDGCTLCCQLVPVPELGVRAFARCPHELNIPFSKTPGCAIYSARPRACREWHCQFVTLRLLAAIADLALHDYPFPDGTVLDEELALVKGAIAGLARRTIEDYHRRHEAKRG